MMMLLMMMMMGVLPMSNDLMKHVSPWLVLAPTSPLCTTCLGQVFNIYIHPLLHCYRHNDENINNCGFCSTFHFRSVRPTTPTSSPMYKGIYAINALSVWAKFSTSSYIPPTYTLMTRSTSFDKIWSHPGRT